MSFPSSIEGSPAVCGMLHIPVDTIVASSRKWKSNNNLPEPTSSDWSFISEVEKQKFQYLNVFHNMRTIEVVEDQTSTLSFYHFLEERMLEEAKIYDENGISSMMLENIAAPYFVRNSIPVAILGVMGRLAKVLRSNYPEMKLGIQLLAFADNFAMQIAVRYGFDFIRAESPLFCGQRPEGNSPNAGNLASLYLERELFANECHCDKVPDVYVDLQKKHTIFPEGTKDLGVWLDNILFQKLEGIILTGGSTGKSVDERDLAQARAVIDSLEKQVRDELGFEYKVPLIVGSGASLSNADMCRKFADAVIVGSGFKVNGFWENCVDADRVARFMENWS